MEASFSSFFSQPKYFRGLAQFLKFYFPYFFPLCQANKIAKVLFSLSSSCEQRLCAKFSQKVNTAVVLV